MAELAKLRYIAPNQFKEEALNLAAQRENLRLIKNDASVELPQIPDSPISPVNNLRMDSAFLKTAPIFAAHFGTEPGPPATPAPGTPLAALYIQYDAYEANRRWRFVFTDISEGLSMDERAVLVRERNGLLRRATNAERLEEVRRVFGRTPPGPMPQLNRTKAEMHEMTERRVKSIANSVKNWRLQRKPNKLNP